MSRDVRISCRRPAFTLEEAARDLAGGVGLLRYSHGEREEVEAGRLLSNTTVTSTALSP